MICFNRLLAKQLRAAVRRALQLNHNAEQVIWLETTTQELRIFSSHARGAVEFRQPGTFQPERLPITLAALTACEGNKATDTIEFIRQSDTQVVARWFDRHVPQSLTIDVPHSAFESPPSQPTSWGDNSPQLISALAEAMDVTDTSSARYALGCVQLRASDGRLAATDSSQLLVQHGFNFPWEGEVLIPQTTIFKQKELWSGNSIRMGRTAEQIAFACEPWTVWLTVQKEGRFPHLEDIIPAANSALTRMVLDERDVDFFLNTVPRLPCDESLHKAVTVELNGHVALLARAENAAPITRAILNHSRREGAELRWLTNRDYLLRAVQLGFREIELRGNAAPAVCRDARRAFVWSLLTPTEAIVADSDVVDVPSIGAAVTPVVSISPEQATTASVPRSFATRRTTRTATNRVAATLSAMNAPPRMRQSVSDSHSTVVPAELSDSTSNFATVLQEAANLKTALRTAHAQISRMITALKRQRRQSKLVQTTLASLQQLQTLEV